VSFARGAVGLAIRSPEIFNFEIATLAVEGAVDDWASLREAQRREFDSELDALWNRLALALRRLADAEHLKCDQNHDVVETGKNITLALKLVENVLLQPMRSAAAYALARRSKCERFELNFESIIILHTNPDIVATVEVKFLRLNPENGWTNQADLDYVEYYVPPPGAPCGIVTTGRGDAPFRAKLGSPLDWYSGGSPPKISLQVSLGKASETTKVICPDGTETLTTRFWEAGVNTFHPGLSWTIDDWSFTDASLFARRAYGSAVGDFSEHMTFELRHTPQ